MTENLGLLPTAAADELARFKAATADLYALKERAFEAGDAETIVTQFYAADATTVGPNGKLVEGRDAFRSMYIEMVKNKTVKIDSWRSFVSGDAGWDWTRFHVRPNDPAKAASTFIILFLWARGRDRWTCAGDMFLADQAATA